MNKNLSSIKITTPFFDGSNGMDFTVFRGSAITPHKLSHIYGANGSGKTSIGRALYSSKKDAIESEHSIRYCDYDSNDLNLNDSEHIYVYNEDYVERNIRFNSETKLKSIVMFGQQLEVDSKIIELREECKDIEKDIKDLNIETFIDEKNIISPYYHYKKIRTDINNTWGIRDQDIKGNKTKSTADESMITSILASSTSKKREDMQKEFDDKLDLYKKVRDQGDNKITTNLNDLQSFSIPLDDISSLVKMTIERPLGSKTIERIAEILKKHSMVRISEIKESFESNPEYCPYCFRDINETESKNILYEITQLQNDELNNFVNSLQKVKLSEINDFFPDLTLIGINEASDIIKAIHSVNDIISDINSIIDKKIENPFDNIEFKFGDIESLKELVKQSTLVNDSIRNYNENLSKKSSLKAELFQLNKELTNSSLKSSIATYNKARIEKENADKSNVSFMQKLQQTKSSIENLESQKANINIALSKINENLEYIFLDKNRLKIELDGTNYVVKVRGKNVPLKKLSNGEKNAIALSYFVTDINENKNEDEYLNFPMLVIFDDPLTSFDNDNKIGIYSFLRKVFEAILANEDSKIVTLTHQLDAMFAFINISDDLGLKNRTTKHVLASKKFFDFKDGNKNLYHGLMIDLGKVVTGNYTGDMSAIGNKIRRTLESFSTFNYGVGIDKVSTDKDIIKYIDDERIREYLKNSMYRITLHSNSHLENQTYGIEEEGLIYYENQDELDRSIKDVLLLIYELNQSHVVKILETDVVSKIMEHKNNIISLE